MSLCVKDSERKEKKGGEKTTNVNFPPVMSKTIKMTDILLLINLRRAVGRRKKKKGKQKKVNRPHLESLLGKKRKQ